MCVYRISSPQLTDVKGNKGSAEAVLHELINDAGIMGTPFKMTEDGFEEQWQVGT